MRPSSLDHAAHSPGGEAPFLDFPYKRGLKGMFCWLAIFCTLLPWTAIASGYKDFVSMPVQVTASSDPVSHFAVSSDGKKIVYITQNAAGASLWVGSADPAVIALPRLLVSDPSLKSDPAVSADGRFAAYSGTINDVKGDIFLIDLSAPVAEALRLTGRDTRDGGPCFSPDGEKLYFHQAGPGPVFHLFSIDLENPKAPPVPIDTDGDAQFPAVSPDGTRLAFVSFRSHPSGDLFVSDLAQKSITQVTRGPAIDMAPQWSTDGKSIYFAQIAQDTDHDGRITRNDIPVICRVYPDAKALTPSPLTPLDTIAFSPRITEDRLYFLFNRAGILNCWATLPDGWIKSLDTAGAQVDLAGRVSGRVPENPYLSLLAWHRVLELFPANQRENAAAAYRIGTLYQKLNLPDAAAQAYNLITDDYRDISPQAGQAKIQQIVLSFQSQMARQTDQSSRTASMDEAIASLSAMEKSRETQVRIEAGIEKAALLISATNAPERMVHCISGLDEILTDPDADPSHKAHALYLKANAYETLKITKSAADTYRKLIVEYPDQNAWADFAVDRYLDGLQAAQPRQPIADRIRRLQQIAAKNQTDAPLLAMGALNRIGDLYAAQEKLEQAGSAYRQVLDTYPANTPRTAAARLALAEIYYRQEQFRKALDLYETEISRRPEEDRIYQLARQAYIRKKSGAGEYHFRLGEVPTARSLFAELMDYDDRIVEAHRGYIKCAAAEGDLQAVIESYRKRLLASPDDPVLLYATGLSLTYLESETSLEQAQDMILSAIAFNGRVQYFYQTLGYIHEVMETVYKKPRRLELALDAYQKAYFLNDSAGNPENAANLELNLGNVFYLLKQYGKALDYFSRREQRKMAFDPPSSGIIFYKRLGECAFQQNDTERAAAAFHKCLADIDRSMDPVEASHAFDRLHGFIRNRIAAPGAKLAQIEKSADQLLSDQADISREVAALTRDAAAPPSAKWQRYHDGMQALLIRQKALNETAAKLGERMNTLADAKAASARVENPRRVLSAMTGQIEQVLDFPERLVQMRIETLDRLGLARQESGQWEAAAEVFEQAFALNQQTGNLANLAKNRRSAAYNTYMLARTATGKHRIDLLTQSAGQFGQVPELVDQYGVAAPKDENSEFALVNLSVQTSLDAAASTRAARGFTKDQEIRLAKTFLSRIATELGHFDQAAKLLEEQLADYPAGKPVAASDQYGVSLLHHRAGLLAYARGDFKDAFWRFESSAQFTLQMKNPVSAMVNLKNMAALLSDFPGPAQGPVNDGSAFSRFCALDRQVRDLLKTYPPPDQNDAMITWHLAMGVCYAKQGRRAGPEAKDSVYALDALMTAQSHFQHGLSLIPPDGRQKTRGAAKQEAMLHLDMACVAEILGDIDRGTIPSGKSPVLMRAGHVPRPEVAGPGRSGPAR